MVPNASASVPAPALPPKLRFYENDLATATSEAKRDGKLVFVDAWATWCHTCVSMQQFVLPDPSLASLAEKAVFVALDTDRPENAEFLDTVSVEILPTFFLMDPKDRRIVGFWPGGASVKEMTRFVTDTHAGWRDQNAGRTPSPSVALSRARTAHAAKNYLEAAKLYAQAVERSGGDWSGRSPALTGWLQALSRGKRYEECTTVGLKYLDDVNGAALPTDYSRILLNCGDELSAKKQKTVRKRVTNRLRAIVSAPRTGASIDDRSDTFGLLVHVLELSGDARTAKEFQEKRLAMLNDAATNAASPKAAAAFDYHRANVYLALGRGSEAVAMLLKREKQLPKSFEPPARLAVVHYKMGNKPECLVALNRALPLAYGPRRLRYLAFKAKVQRELGQRQEAIATLRDEIAGHKQLPKGQFRPKALAGAERRLQAVKESTPR